MKNLNFITNILVTVSSFLAISIAFLTINDDAFFENSRYLITILIFLVLFFIGITLFWRLYRDTTAARINKLVQYDKKRKEIEQEINALTKQLIKTDAAEYLDVNRLIFGGQNSVLSDGAINYENFLHQFGITNKELLVKEDTAMFLTPFDDEGEYLFRKCQSILSDVNIFLQRSDNHVDKDDIIMNVVSLIVQSELIIANVDGRNPNVYYEIGIAHALGKPTILISKTDIPEQSVNFDVRQKRIIMYKNMHDLERELLYQVSRLKSKNSTNSNI